MRIKTKLFFPLSVSRELGAAECWQGCGEMGLDSCWWERTGPVFRRAVCYCHWGSSQVHKGTGARMFIVVYVVRSCRQWGVLPGETEQEKHRDSTEYHAVTLRHI